MVRAGVLGVSLKTRPTENGLEIEQVPVDRLAPAAWMAVSAFSADVVSTAQPPNSSRALGLHPNATVAGRGMQLGARTAVSLDAQTTERAMTDVSKSIGERVGDLAHAVGGVVGKKADGVAEQSIKKGAELASGLGAKAGAVADRIDENASSLSGHVRETADKVNRFADDLHDKKAADILQAAMDYGRAHPMMMMAGAGLLGFALARLTGRRTVSRNDDL